jgi:hypothetical protein
MGLFDDVQILRERGRGGDRLFRSFLCGHHPASHDRGGADNGASHQKRAAIDTFRNLV